MRINRRPAFVSTINNFMLNSDDTQFIVIHNFQSDSFTKLTSTNGIIQAKSHASLIGFLCMLQTLLYGEHCNAQRQSHYPSRTTKSIALKFRIVIMKLNNTDRHIDRAPNGYNVQH